MPIKNFVSGDVPFLVRYEPYQLNENDIEPSSITDMFSIDVQPGTSTIEYDIGAAGTYRLVINIKNLTNNAVLDVRALVPPDVFVSDQARIISTQPLRQVIERFINPLEQIEINLKINTKYLDSQVGEYQTTLPITIRSRQNSSVITKNINVARLQSISLPDVIKVT